MIRNPSVTPPEVPEPGLFGDFNLKYCLEIGFRRKATFLIPAVLTPFLSVVISLFIHPIYQSTTTILLGKSAILNPLVRFETAVSLTEWERLRDFRQVIYSRPLIEDVIESLDLGKNVTSQMDFERLVRHVRSNIEIIDLSGDSFEIGCTADSAVLARDMVETVSRLFIEKSLEGSRREASVAVDFIQAQLQHYSEQLDRSQADLQRFKVDNIEDIRRMVTVNPAVLEYRTKIMEAKLELKEEQLSVELLGKRLSGEAPMVTAGASFYAQNDPFNKRLLELQVERARLTTTRDRTHPEVIAVQREIDSLMAMAEAEKATSAEANGEVRSPVYQELAARLADSHIEVAVLQKKIEEYETTLTTLEEQALRVPGLEKELNKLDGDVAINREVYNTLMGKLEHANISREVEIEQQANRFTIIEPPRVPLSRHRPIIKYIAAAGIAVGAFIGIGIVFLLELGDPRVIRVQEIERDIRSPVTGTVPEVATDRLSELLIVGLLKQIVMSVPGLFSPSRVDLPSTFAKCFLLTPEWLRRQKGGYSEKQLRFLQDLVERFRDIGLTACDCYDDADGLVWTIGSAEAREGKTLVAANLGVVLANDWKKPVAVIDANPGPESLSTFFGLGEAPGLFDYIEGRADLEEIICPTDSPFLKVIPAGTSSEDPAAPLQSPRFGEFLAALRGQFALTLVEVADLHGHSDGRIVTPLTDGLLLVTRLYHTKKRAILHAVDKVSHEKVIGIVTNRKQYWIPNWLYRWV